MTLPITAVREIAADEIGRFLVMERYGKVYRQKKVNGAAFELIGTVANVTGGYSHGALGTNCGSNTVTDLGVGGDGTIFAVSTLGTLYKYNAKKEKFELFDSRTIFTDVAVTPEGDPWIIDTDGRIRAHDGAGFKYLNDTTKVTSFDIGLNGTVAACKKSDNTLMRYNHSTNRFDDTTSQCYCVAVGPTGKPVTIYRRSSSSNLKTMYEIK